MIIKQNFHDFFFQDDCEPVTLVDYLRVSTPLTPGTMDWALEELLQDPPESFMIKTNNPGGNFVNFDDDYIDQLHEMLNQHHDETSDEAVSMVDLPPPLPKDIIPTSNDQSVQDHGGGTIEKSCSTSKEGEDDLLLPVLSPPEGYRDGPPSPSQDHLLDHLGRSMTQENSRNSERDPQSCPPVLALISQSQKGECLNFNGDISQQVSS